MSKVSVIIPLYNKASHIRRAIDSALSQTVSDIEIIVVDDASTDGGRAVVEEYHDSRVKLLRRFEPGPGGYAARNLGIEVAKSPWVAFLDADDEWLPNHLEVFLSEINSNTDLDIYGAAYRKHFGSGKYMPCGRAQRFDEESVFQRLSFEGFLESLIEAEQVIWTSAAIVRRSVFATAGNFPEGKTKRGGDTDTWLRVAYNSRCVGWSPKVTVVYHMESENMVTRTAVNFERRDIITATCDEIIRSAKTGRVIGLLKRVQAQKFYELSMARKKLCGRYFFSLPELRAYYFIVCPKTVLCFIPDFIYRFLRNNLRSDF